MSLPERAAPEHILKERPLVPEIPRDAPHRRIPLVKCRLLDEGRPRREREHDLPPALLKRRREHLDLMLHRTRPAGQRVGVGHVVALDEIHAPGGVERRDRIIILLPRRRILHAVHMRVPPADRGRVRDLGRVRVRAEHRRVCVRRLPRDAAHDVDAEKQPLPVDVIRERLEAGPAPGGRKALRIGQEARIRVHVEIRERNVLVLATPRARPGRVPLDVDHDVFPAEGHKMRRHEIGVPLHVRLGHRRVVIVIAVPSHRGCSHGASSFSLSAADSSRRASIPSLYGITRQHASGNIYR